ncbi:MAG TPA: extracellular solute-binding protein [Stellaceae bacterium]|nr:extracellular solute-binding protein [Stellaceae bacterium]
MRRRDFLIAGGTALGAAPLAGIAPALAQGKPDKIVIMTWGGLWGDSLRQGVDTPFEKATGVTVLQDRGSSPVQRITKLKVSLDNQGFDLLQLHDGLYPLAVKQGVIEPINRNSPRLTNLKDVYPQFIHPDWVVQIFSAIGVTYNTKLVKNPPTSFADLWRPEFKGRIVLPEISHSIGTYIIPIGAMAEGKSPKDAETGFTMLKKMVELQPIWAKDTDTIMNSLRDEEAVVALLYKSQTYTVQGWGTPVKWVYPKEGAIAISWGTSIAKNTKHKELAETYLNLTLDPQGQTFFTKAFNYPGSNRKELALLSPELQERAKFSPDELAHLVELDHEFMSNERAAWTERWNRIVAGG